MKHQPVSRRILGSVAGCLVALAAGVGPEELERVFKQY